MTYSLFRLEKRENAARAYIYIHIYVIGRRVFTFFEALRRGRRVEKKTSSAVVISWGRLWGRLGAFRRLDRERPGTSSSTFEAPQGRL